MKRKTHKLVVDGGYFDWLCGSDISLDKGESLSKRVVMDWKKVTCKKCLAMKKK